MAQPGRPKRRNKISGNAYASQIPQQQQQQQRQHQQQQQFRQIKEDSIAQIHDEADLISFRNDALNRYITNHEYIDNITAKNIHTSKIIPPAVFPVSQKSNERKPEELYFGDLDYMKKKAEELMEELKEEKAEQQILSDESVFQRDAVKRMSELQSQVQDEKLLAELEGELDNILEVYNKKYDKKFESISSVKQFSVPIGKIANIEVREAPENYNPRSINSLINMNGNHSHSSNGTRRDQMDNASLPNEHLEDGQFGIEGGMFMDQFGDNNSARVEYQPSNGMNNSFAMQVMNQPPSSAGNPQNENNEKNTTDRSIIDDEINDLFNDNNEGDVMDSNPSDDPMGELINFEGNEDEEELMPSNSFEQDFLSHIDPSME